MLHMYVRGIFRILNCADFGIHSGMLPQPFTSNSPYLVFT